MTFTVIIPARLSSSRLPDKPLLDVAGRPMVIRTAQQASKSNAKEVIIACDDIRILQAAEQHGFKAILTATTHSSGTDRLSEAAKTLKLPESEIIVNVQGDEPCINPNHINLVADKLNKTHEADIATCASPIQTAETLFNPNHVKVVCALNGQALYFSRAPIPWARDALAKTPHVLAPQLPALHHIGIYAYRAQFLYLFPQLSKTPLEQVESLEQLRALEHGYRIFVEQTTSPAAPGVDTENELKLAQEYWANFT